MTTPEPAHPARPASSRRRLSRRAAVLAVLGGGALLLVTTALPWASAPVRSATQTTTMSVTGGGGAPLVPSAALVVLAAGLAIALAGRVARVLAAVAVAVGGCLATFAAITFLRDPGTAVRAAAGPGTGVRDLAGAVQSTPWPVVAIVIAAALAVLGLALPFLMGTWDRVGQRYERDAPPAPGGTRQHIADWDALSRGEDPSESEDR